MKHERFGAQDWVVLRMLEGCALQAAVGLSLTREVFCPILTVRRPGRGPERHKMITHQHPLLVGYFFARLHPHDGAALVGGPRIRYRVMSGAEGWLRVPGYQLSLVRDMEARANEAALPITRPLAIGDTVRVIRGLLEGDLLKVVAVRKRFSLVYGVRSTKPFSVPVGDLEIARA